MTNPYSSLPDRNFWKRAVSNRHVTELSQVAGVIPELETSWIATAGSCFAQHIGRNLRKRKLQYMDMEPAPHILTPEDANKLGYEIYSCRYGNIYTVRQLIQLFAEAFGKRTPIDPVWRRDDERYFDALRPGVEQDGFGCEQEVRTLRQHHLQRVREMFERLDIFVFTLGLTEAWEDISDGTVFPIAPGVIAGTYNPERHKLRNFRYPEIMSDLETFLYDLRAINPKARMLCTVSPVPLAATATDQHVLVATTWSKSTLRAVAGDFASSHDGVYYFPSYELVVGQPTRHMYYKPDLRNVAASGVDEVMKHFFSSVDFSKLTETSADDKGSEGLQRGTDLPDLSAFIHCEEDLIEGSTK